MPKFRMTPWVVGSIGGLLWIGVILFMCFVPISKENQVIAAQKQAYQPNAIYIDYDTNLINQTQLDAANKQLTDAKTKAAVVDAKWNYVLDTKNPRIDYSSRWQAWLEWATEVDYDFAPRLNKFLKHTGVITAAQVGAPSFPTDPNDVPMGLLAAPLPSITVYGSYKQIVNHISDWNRFSRIVMLDNLSLQGYNPFMTGTYSATEYIFTRNSDSPGAPVPSSTAVTGAKPPMTSESFDQQPGFNGHAP